MTRERPVAGEAPDRDQAVRGFVVTGKGHELLALARPTHDEVLAAALEEATGTPELRPLVEALATLWRGGFSRPTPCRDSAVSRT